MTGVSVRLVNDYDATVTSTCYASPAKRPVDRSRKAQWWSPRRIPVMSAPPSTSIEGQKLGPADNDAEDYPWPDVRGEDAASDPFQGYSHASAYGEPDHSRWYCPSDRRGIFPHLHFHIRVYSD